MDTPEQVRVPQALQHSARIRTVGEALEGVAANLKSETAKWEADQILSSGANIEYVVQVTRRPEGQHRVTLKRYALMPKQQLVCFTRLSRK